ncbi:MAG: hypothetical protein OXT74_04200 [Candidatus Poribacteria bacterium]|nr:hypothetical protein [Candidatus Poribacteria bacterium]
MQANLQSGTGVGFLEPPIRQIRTVLLPLGAPLAFSAWIVKSDGVAAFPTLWMIAAACYKQMTIM